MICSVEGCERPAKGKREWCAMHTERWRRWGDPTETRPRIRTACIVEGCDRLHEAQGWCQLHYRRYREHGNPLHRPHSTRTRSPLLERLLRKIDQSGGDDACWIWTGNVNERGYGQTYIDRGDKRIGTGAHRAMYIAVNGDIDDGLFVLHGCNNPPCCNPKHLRAGTQVENMADRREHGAGYPRGNDAPRAVQLTDELVQAIRATYRPRVKGRGQHAIAQQFGLSRTTVQRIVTESDRWAESA